MVTNFCQYVYFVPNLYMYTKFYPWDINQLYNFVSWLLSEEASGRNDMDTLMIPVERACVTEQGLYDPNRLRMTGNNDYSFECETAVNNIFGNGKYRSKVLI